MLGQLSFDMDARQEPSREDCVRAAAFFDGEGCVSLSLVGKGVKNVRAQVIIGNTHLPMLEWYRERWGGLISRKRDRIEKRPQWQWYLGEQRMAIFLEDIGPLVMVKAPAVENARAYLRLKLQRRPHARSTADERAALLPFLKAHHALELDLRPHVLKRRAEVA